MSQASADHTDEQIEQLLAQLQLQTGIDLREYSRPTVRRRILARVATVGAQSVAQYADLLRSKAGEGQSLVEAVLVHVSTFDRDPEVWAALSAHVLPLLAKASASQRRQLRAWSAGCAHGPEAWSLAMRLYDVSGGEFELFATDLDEFAVQVATRARYSQAELLALPASQLSRWFEPDGSFARPKAALRNQVRFERHDLAGPQLAPTGAIVAQFDVILCRNVLIYLQSRLRDVCVKRFAGMLRPGGALVLGQSEGLTLETSGLFTSFSNTRADLRIFQRIRGPQ